MKFRAIHKIRDPVVKDAATIENVVIISILPRWPGAWDNVVFVREDGTIGQDTVSQFTIFEGAWVEFQALKHSEADQS